jgi:hypothetical protein
MNPTIFLLIAWLLAFLIVILRRQKI